MKLNVMFIIAAFFLSLQGILSLLAPVVPAMSDLLGASSVSAAFSIMLGGVGMLSLGVIAWLVRNTEPSKTRDLVVLGYTFLFALWAAVSVYGSFLDMPARSISWVPALIQALITVGFFMAGKASMSKA
ncbi:MAG: hypothetical protein HZC40_20020 [Chloroflexi bacterium]|nr:hypothetical protein [Chloroflexota bacterium]